ncbi:MAG: hypothetical protein HW419_4045 [Deltaproteobacteria bacterium]|nr:hypothetical protein [Deltaproteobacteria bacterium]
MLRETRIQPLFLIALSALLVAMLCGNVFFSTYGASVDAATATGVTQPPSNTLVTPPKETNVGKLSTTAAPFDLGYSAPTESLTKVANAIALHTFSLTTQISVRDGLVLTKPVCITVFYHSYSGRAYSNVLSQAYNAAGGNRLVFDDLEGLGTPRQATLRIQLFEPGSGGCGPRVIGKSFDLPTMRVNLDPLYDVGVRPIQVTRIEDCPMLRSDISARWFSPDDRLHETTFRFGTAKTILVPGSQWNAQTLTASSNYHKPNVGLYGFHIPSAPSTVNLIPAPMLAGKPMAAQEIKFQMREPNRRCTAQVRYIIDRKISRYIDPSNPASQAVQREGLLAR